MKRLLIIAIAISLVTPIYSQKFWSTRNNDLDANIYTYLKIHIAINGLYLQECYADSIPLYPSMLDNKTYYDCYKDIGGYIPQGMDLTVLNQMFTASEKKLIWLHRTPTFDGYTEFLKNFLLKN